MLAVAQPTQRRRRTDEPRCGPSPAASLDVPHESSSQPRLSSALGEVAGWGSSAVCPRGTEALLNLPPGGEPIPRVPDGTALTFATEDGSGRLWHQPQIYAVLATN